MLISDNSKNMFFGGKSCYFEVFVAKYVILADFSLILFRLGIIMYFVGVYLFSE